MVVKSFLPHREQQLCQQFIEPCYSKTMSVLNKLIIRLDGREAGYAARVIWYRFSSRWNLSPLKDIESDNNVFKLTMASDLSWRSFLTATFQAHMDWIFDSERTSLGEKIEKSIATAPEKTFFMVTLFYKDIMMKAQRVVDKLFTSVVVGWTQVHRALTFRP